MLEQAISEVYLPLLCNMDFTDASDSARAQPSDDSHTSGSEEAAATAEDMAATRVNERMDGYKSEFVITMQKFASHISHTTQQIAGETRLKIPDEILSLKLHESNAGSIITSYDYNVVKTLEGLAEEWVVTIVGALARETKKTPVGNVSHY